MPIDVEKEVNWFKRDCSIFDIEYGTSETVKRMWKKLADLESEVMRIRKS